MENDRIKGGAFHIARKMFEGDLWLNKPSSWKVIWIYILGRVNHQDTHNLKKGEGFFQWSKEISQVGNDITPAMIKSFTAYAKSTTNLTTEVAPMIATRRTTRGVYIKVLNYEVYQDLDNYSTTNITTKKQLRNNLETTPINKNVKNVKNDNTYPSIPFEEFWNLYPKKVERKKSEEKWQRLPYEKQKAVLEDIPRRLHGRQWKEGFIPNPTTYINGERWNDVIEDFPIKSSGVLILK